MTYVDLINQWSVHDDTQAPETGVYAGRVSFQSL